jgi:hypothetical protein
MPLKEDLPESIKKGDKNLQLLKEFKINNSYIIGVYQGSISDLDMLIKYRQKSDNKWSYLRTPKHIHWTVDILIKMYNDRESLSSFVSFLEDIWDSVTQHTTNESRRDFLSRELQSENQEIIEGFQRFNSHGEYSIRFLLVLAKLLMQQEKNNLSSAYMFKNLLEKLKSGEDLFSILSVATHNSRR